MILERKMKNSGAIVRLYKYCLHDVKLYHLDKSVDGCSCVARVTVYDKHGKPSDEQSAWLIAIANMGELSPMSQSVLLEELADFVRILFKRTKEFAATKEFADGGLAVIQSECLPTRIVKPVGYWIRPTGVSEKSYRWLCSSCDNIAISCNIPKKRVTKPLSCGLPYCPNCGSEMRENSGMLPQKWDDISDAVTDSGKEN